MSTPSYPVDIIVVSFNTKKYLAACLESIRAYSGHPGDYRVTVVDNASTDGSPALIRSTRWVRGIFNSTNRGYGAACNQGIKSGAGEYIFLLNSDTMVTPGWLPSLLQLLARPDTAVAGPRLVTPDGFLAGAGVTGSNSRPILRGWGEPDDPGKYNEITECLSVSGACMGIKRALLPELGYFDEHYFHYFEETDYCYNARFHGYKIFYCPESKVIHRVAGSCRNPRRLQRYFREGERYFQKKWEGFLADPQVYG